MATLAEIESAALSRRNESSTLATGGGAPTGNQSNGVVFAVRSTVGRTLADWFSDTVSVASFGASPSASGTTNRVSIQAAIDACAAAGGGIVLIPPGEYTVDRIPDAAGSLVMASNVWLRGSGRGSTTIKLKDGVDSSHIIGLTSVSRCAVTDLAINGNRGNTTGNTHGVRCASVDDILIDNLYVYDALHYGIGLQDGAITNVTISNNIVERSGADSIDVKNQTNSNKNVVICFNTIKDHGQNTGLSTQAGIDLRGPCRVYGNAVLAGGPAASLNGIRTREGETDAANGEGAHYAVVHGNFVELAKSDGVNFAISARRGTFSSNISRGAATAAFLISQAGNTLTACIAQGANGQGFRLRNQAGALPTEADDVVLTGCMAFDCGSDGFRLEGARSRLIGCGAFDNTGYGFRVLAAASDNAIIEWHGTGNVAGMLTDAGTRTAMGNKVAIGAYTIASGVITITAPGLVTIDTEGAASTDDLTTILGAFPGWEITVCSTDAARVPTLKDSTGNLRLASDFALSSPTDTITLIYTSGGWLEKGRSDNA